MNREADMSDIDSYIKEKERLEEIVLQTRAKDVPLEKSLDLYDEALAIGTRCVEQLEKTDFTAEELESLAENPEVELSGRVTEHPEVALDAQVVEEYIEEPLNEEEAAYFEEPFDAELDDEEDETFDDEEDEAFDDELD